MRLGFESHPICSRTKACMHDIESVVRKNRAVHDIEWSNIMVADMQRADLPMSSCVKSSHRHSWQIASDSSRPLQLKLDMPLVSRSGSRLAADYCCMRGVHSNIPFSVGRRTQKRRVAERASSPRCGELSVQRTFDWTPYMYSYVELARAVRDVFTTIIRTPCLLRGGRPARPTRTECAVC